MAVYAEVKNGISLKIYVQPNANHSDLNGIYDDCLRVKIKAPPIDGEANKELVRFLAKFFKITKNQVIIRHGLSNKRKIVILEGVTLNQMKQLAVFAEKNEVT